MCASELGDGGRGEMKRKQMVRGTQRRGRGRVGMEKRMSCILISYDLLPISVCDVSVYKCVC